MPFSFFFSFYSFLLQASCPTGWTESPHTGTCIKLYDEEKSWHGARVACKEEAADLVKIKDDGMNQFIWGKAKDHCM